MGRAKVQAIVLFCREMEQTKGPKFQGHSLHKLIEICSPFWDALGANEQQK